MYTLLYAKNKIQAMNICIERLHRSEGGSGLSNLENANEDEISWSNSTP